MICAGIGAGLTGSGADLIIVDDPIKDMEEASSLLIRDAIHDWFTSVALTRLSPGGKVLIVMTRWHHDDLVGRLLTDNPDGWEVLHLPAINDAGEALWPERYGIDHLMSIKADVGSRVFEALYQGRPTPDEGGFFRREWFQVVDRGFSEGAYRCRYWDKAATAGGGDWTTGVLIATEGGRYCIEDVVHVQYGPKDVQAVIRRTAELDGRAVRIRMEQEPGSSGVEVIDLYARQILVGYDFRPDKVTGSKDLRAGALSAALECGNVSIVRANWNRDLIQEFCEFPLGAHDDQVDAAAGAFRELTDTGPQHIEFF
jgi:predicted phage terminase large subunit-like protein